MNYYRLKFIQRPSVTLIQVMQDDAVIVGSFMIPNEDEPMWQNVDQHMKAEQEKNVPVIPRNN